MAPEDEPLVEFRGVSHTYGEGDPVVRDVSLHISAGERLAVVGPSGAGKSTLLRMVNGLITPTAGEVWVMGRCISAMPEKGRGDLRRSIGMVFQEFALVERLSALQNVLIGRLGYVPQLPSLVRAFPSSAVGAGRRALAEVGLEGYGERQVRRLSGGQKQRVGVARALVQQPTLILADEPTANLDLRTADEVLQLLVDVGRRHGTTLVLNLHDVRAARRFCDRIVGLRDGKVAWDGPASRFDDRDVERLFYSGSESRVDNRESREAGTA